MKRDAKVLTSRTYSGVLERLKAAGLRPAPALGWPSCCWNRPAPRDRRRALPRGTDRRDSGVARDRVQHLHQFTAVGLLREVVVDMGQSYFDTNISRHHHFFDETTGALTDIPDDDIEIGRLPTPPLGLRDRARRGDRSPAPGRLGSAAAGLRDEPESPAALGRRPTVPSCRPTFPRRPSAPGQSPAVARSRGLLTGPRSRRDHSSRCPRRTSSAARPVRRNQPRWPWISTRHQSCAQSARRSRRARRAAPPGRHRQACVAARRCRS